jgi:hypothetical protein
MSNDLQQAWDQLQNELSTSFSTNKVDIMTAITQESRNPISKLKRATKLRSNWSLFFSVFCLIGALASYNYPLAILIWGIGFGYYFSGWMIIRHQLEHLQNDFDESIKSVIENYYNRISYILSIDEKIGSFMIPFSVVMGYTLSSVYDGESLSSMINDGVGMAGLLAIVIIFTAFAFWYTKRLNYKAYGKYLEKLKTNLDMLNTIE